MATNREKKKRKKLTMELRVQCLKYNVELNNKEVHPD